MNNSKSEIDGGRFFISPLGKNNPQAELDATLVELFNDKDNDDNATGCLYPARKRYLQKVLHVEGVEEFPTLTCTSLDAMLKRVDPKSATFIFPSAHINSPASMFGHTFLRIDSSYKSKLLSHAINYSATADQDKENGMLFAVKGLLGGYSGIYSLLPYYDKLKEYRDSDQRDIWEYDLNLTQDEVNQMILHIWELKDSFSWYYFFDENCSYNMLWLVEIARDTVHLREKFFYQVLPIETVFALDDENLIAKRHFRPSLRTKLLAYEKKLGSTNAHKVYQLGFNKIRVQSVLEDEHLSIAQKRTILDASSEFLEYLHIENKISTQEYKERFYDVLLARSSLKKGEKLSIKVPINPDKSHKSRRLSLQSASLNGYLQTLLAFRLTYHSLDDSDNGLLRGTQIESFNIVGSYSKESEFQLEKATLLSLTSIAAHSTFFQPFSWRTHFGFDRDTLDNELVFQADIGGGYSFASDYGYIYMVADLFSYFDRVEHLGVSASLGLVLYESQNFKFNSEFTQRLYVDSNLQSLASLSQLYSVNAYMALKLQYEFVQQNPINKQTARFSLDLYF